GHWRRVGVCCLFWIVSGAPGRSRSAPCVFCFPRPAAPGDLPPFPTRRSSDLYGTESCLELDLKTERFSSQAPGLADSPFAEAIRSEEHTSELQSRENLVCRLLLEKKKEAHPLDGAPRHAPRRRRAA